MLQALSTSEQQLLEEQLRQAPDAAHYLAIARRRIFHFLIPFTLVFAVGALLVLIQRPIYMAEGRILVESQDIPTDLVRPTVTDTANQRIQVIQQLIMTRDNLWGLVTKYGLFAGQREYMTTSQIIELMRERTKLQLVDLTRANQQNNLTIAVTLSFEYEDPGLAQRVTNEFLTLILAEDAKTRTTRAAETTRFLGREVKRLEGELATIDGQIVEVRKQAGSSILPTPADPLRAQLAQAKAEYVQKSAVYSATHPDVKALKKKVAGLEELVNKTPEQTPATPKLGLEELVRNRTVVEKSLDEANHKLTAARLGESLERDQQSERLRVIEQPKAPEKPIRPNRLKLFAVVLALAGVAGFGTIFTAEALDHSIRSRRELARLVDSRLIVSIPYIVTAQEARATRWKWIRRITALCVILLAAIGAVIYFNMFGDLSTWIDRDWMNSLRSWRDMLTRLSK